MVGLVAVCGYLLIMGFGYVPERAGSDLEDKGFNIERHKENRWRRDNVSEQTTIWNIRDVEATKRLYTPMSCYVVLGRGTGDFCSAPAVYLIDLAW
jgi:hypothetical protein